jgi:hypothetical protein
MQSIDPKIMQQVLGGTKGTLDIISVNYQRVASNLEEIRANQNDMMLALASVYAALEAIAKNSNVTLPKPLIAMNIEEVQE